MKKITMILPDRHGINLARLMNVALEFHVENVKVARASVVVKPTESNGTTRCKIHGTSVPETIMKHYATGARFDRATGQGWLTEVGYSATSLSQGLSILTREGKVKVVGRGLYEFVSKTGEQPVKRKVKMKKSAIRVAKAV